MPPLNIVLRPSRQLLVLLVVAHLLVLFMLQFLPFVWWARLALAVCVAASCFYYLARDALLFLPSSCVGLHLDEGRCVLSYKSGENLSGILDAGSTVTPLLMVLKLRSAEEKRSTCSVVLLSDSADAEVLRKMRVFLRWSALQANNPSAR